jgi:hypothetical protein
MLKSVQKRVVALTCTVHDPGCLLQEHTSYTPDQLAWALSMVHSRSFLQGATHFLVPGVDFCNHSFLPSATVRILHSPNSCQVGSGHSSVCSLPLLGCCPPLQRADATCSG